MPPPLDLVGQRFGGLLVLARAADVISASGKTVYAAWLCRCDCGREEVLMQKRLPYCASNAARRDAAQACTHCRVQRTCAVCSRMFQAAHYKMCCSEACHTQRQRSIYREHYHRKVAQDPLHNTKARAASARRAAADPEYAARLAQVGKEQSKRRRARIAADPLLQERERERARARYATNAQAIQERRRAARAAMAPEEYAAWSARAREYSRRYAQKLRSTPEGRERYRAYMREYLRQQALRGLVSAGDELIKRSLNDEGR